MNRHFEDARYYLARALENAKHGVKTELESVEAWLRAKTGREPEPTPGRTERARSALRTVRVEVEESVDEGIAGARGRLDSIRGKAN